jgi:hypothetical protein
MSQMIIKVIDVEVNTGKTKTGKDYEFLEVAFKNVSFQDKAETKKVMPFGSKEVFNVLRKATKGQVFTIHRTKNEGGYWDWDGIAEGEVTIETADKGAGPATKAPATTAKSTFETPEERAKKQLYIIRQSSLSNAIEVLKTDKKNPTVEEVLQTSDIFVDYVMGVNLEADKPKLPELDEDDIPY